MPNGLIDGLWTNDDEFKQLLEGKGHKVVSVDPHSTVHDAVKTDVRQQYWVSDSCR